MSGDKEAQDQMPEDDFPADEGMDDMDMAGGEGAPEDFDAMDDQDFSAEGDFVEEDWESYDDEEYIDDGEGDGGLAERRAAFNKILIGGAVVVALGVGGYTLMSGEEENMGLPQMEKVAEVTPVAPDQKVEFHAETKVDAKDAFGVTYGERVEEDEMEEEVKKPAAGLLNNPGMLDDIRSQAPPYEYEDEQPIPRPEVVEGSPPMPAPISQGGPGLMPMPDIALRPDTEDDPFADEDAAMDIPSSPSVPTLPTAQDIVLDKETASMDVDDSFDEGLIPTSPPEESMETDSASPFADETGAETVAAIGGETAPVGTMSAAENEKLDMILSRLDDLDDLKDSIQALEKRIDKLEKAPRQTAARSAPAKSSSASTAVKKSSSTSSSVRAQAQVQSAWVLKSAQPGQALVARKGENDMVRVSVGETLSGLGRITDIHMQNGRWVVQGTKNKITQ